MMPRYKIQVQLTMTGEVEFNADDEKHAASMVDNPSFVDDALNDFDESFGREYVQMGAIELISEETAREER